MKWQADLTIVQEWMAPWQAGLNPYDHHRTPTTRHHAFFLLWLLNFGSSATAFAALAVANALLAIVACYLVVRWFGELTAITLSGQS